MHCNRCSYLSNVFGDAHDRCPLNMSHQDIVRMNTDTELTDKDGNPIEIHVPPPEYMSEPFGK